MIARVSRSVMYAGFATAGVAMLQEPSKVISEQLGTITATWSIFIIAGSALNFFGAATDYMAGEQLGITLLGPAVGLWGAAYLVSNGLTNARFALGVALIGVMFGLGARWWDLHKRAKQSAFISREARDNGRRH